MYDVLILGAGPGGYVAAIRAAQLGLKTCVIEKENVGGVCLNWGCIPSKNLINQAEAFLCQPMLKEMGLTIDTKNFDYGRVQKQSRKAVKNLVGGVEYLLKKNKVDVLKGTGKITSKNIVTLDNGTDIPFKNLIIATGSRPMDIPGFECDESQVLSSNGILALQKLPKRLVILGGGAIGCEFAYVMNAFGVKVTLVEMMDHLLPFEDNETVAILETSFKKHGIKVMTSTRALSINKTPKTVTITVEAQGKTQKELEAEKVLCVFGRIPNTDNIGLDKIGLKTDKGYISVKDFYRTAIDNVFAIGDVVNTPLLAHVASKEGEIAVEYIAGQAPEIGIDVNLIPSAIYCHPQVASFGLREDQAKTQNISYEKAVFPYRGVGKAVAVDKTEGLIKILSDPKTGEILGTHIVGYDATELIHEILLAKSAELLPEDIGRMIHAHPTLSELVMEGAKSIYGEAIHI